MIGHVKAGLGRVMALVRQETAGDQLGTRIRAAGAPGKLGHDRLGVGVEPQPIGRIMALELGGNLVLRPIGEPGG